MLRFLGLSAALAALAATPAAAQLSKAQELQSIKTAIGGLQAEAPRLQQRNDALQRDSANAKKEADLYAGQKPRLDVQIAAFGRRAQAHDADAQAQHAEVARFNAQCRGELPPAQYQACVAWQARVNDWGQRVNLRKASLDGERARIKAQADAYDRRMQQIKTRMARNAEESARIQARLQQIRAQLDALRQRFASICASLRQSPDDVGEALAHCRSVDFDGTNPNRPPLINPPPPSRITPN